MSVELAALMAVALSIMGIIGVVVPVIPGSIFLLVGQLVWFVAGHPPLRWLWLVSGVTLILLGSVASLLLTKKRLGKAGVPPWPVTVALVAGVVAGFALPGVGLLGGFLGALLICELIRVKHVGQALRTSWTAVTSVGLGMVVELGCDLLACTVLGASILVALAG